MLAYLIFSISLFSPISSFAEISSFSENHFYIIQNPETNLDDTLKSIPLVGGAFGDKIKGQGLFLDTSSANPQVFFLGLKKNATKIKSGYEFEIKGYRYSINNKNKTISRLGVSYLTLSGLGLSNEPETFNLKLISKSPDLSDFNTITQSYIKAESARKVLDKKNSTLLREKSLLEKKISTLNNKILSLSNTKKTKLLTHSKSISSNELDVMRKKINALEADLISARITIKALGNINKSN